MRAVVVSAQSSKHSSTALQTATRKPSGRTHRLLRHAEERVLEHLIHHPVHLIHHAKHLGKRVTTTWKHPAGFKGKLGWLVAQMSMNGSEP
jgi:hypothetical protein